MSKIPIVQGIYDAFGRGDIPAILDTLADDVRWEHWPTGNSAQDAGVPYLAPLRRREGVADFFAEAAKLEFHSFEPVAFLEGGNDVVARVLQEVTIKSTGRRFRDDELHYWSFDDAGKVAEFRHYVDTAKHIEGLAR